MYVQQPKSHSPACGEIPPNLVATNILKQIANLGRHTRIERTKLLGIVEAAARDCKRVRVQVGRGVQKNQVNDVKNVESRTFKALFKEL